MQEITVIEPDVSYTKAVVKCDFAKTDACIDEIEKRYKTLVVDADNKQDRKMAKDICAELNKKKKELSEAGKATKQKMLADVTVYEEELKKRINRLEEIKKPLWDQVKPEKKEKAEPKKIGYPIKVCYLFEGDSNYISDMINAAMFNDIKVKEVKL